MSRKPSPGPYPRSRIRRCDYYSFLEVFHLVNQKASSILDSRVDFLQFIICLHMYLGVNS